MPSRVSVIMPALPGTKLMTPGGMPAASRHTHHVVRAQHRARRRLPDRHAAHEHGRRGQVAADRREVERRDRVDEPLERPVLELVPDAGAVDRLLAVELLRVADVEAPEVDQLAGRVDLRLKRRLRLPQHRRRVDRGAPGRGEQLGRLQEDRRAILERPVRPLAPRRRAPPGSPSARAWARPCASRPARACA